MSMPSYKPIKPKTNTLFRGDNLAIMRALPDAFVDLVYIDPPFFTQRDYQNIWGDRESVQDFEEIKTLGFSDKKDFFERNIRSNAKGLDAYLEWMRFRIQEIHRILKTSGSFYLHLDDHAIHYVKVICDEIFGYNNFRSQIIWKRKNGSNSTTDSRGFSSSADFLLLYSKSKDFTFNQPYEAHSDEYLSRYYKYDDEDGKGKYRLGPLSAPSYSPSLIYDFKGISAPKNGWRWTKDRMEAAYKQGILYFHSNGKGTVSQKQYLSDMRGTPISNIWTDIPLLVKKSGENTGWPTQKPVRLLERIIEASSNEGDIVFDCFAGCGTTMMAAHKLKRKWIGIDISPTAAKVSKKRLKEAKAKIETSGLQLEERDVNPTVTLQSKKDIING